MNEMLRTIEQPRTNGPLGVREQLRTKEAWLPVSVLTARVIPMPTEKEWTLVEVLKVLPPVLNFKSSPQSRAALPTSCETASYRRLGM